MKLSNLIYGAVGLTAILYIIPAFNGQDLWEYTDEKFGPGSSDYLTYFYLILFVIGLIYAIFKIVKSWKNLINDNKKG